MEGEPLRRWFSNHSLDLIVWQSDSDVVGFQLCYDKTREERVLIWQSTDGYSHTRVDLGECRPGRHKAAPLLIPDANFDANQVIREFIDTAAAIEPEIFDFVYTKLLEYEPTE
ncbi:MAG TPA: hypothetical protein VFY81_04580 [Gammaproteobacteria bacterium]|nr:hypothetical protein [Gammaproteobacteria bacterium]